MKNATLNTNGSAFTDEQTLRVTALAYLKEALVKERYEECAELIAAAKLYGATPREIKVEIVRALRRLKPRGQTRIPAITVTRRRF